LKFTFQKAHISIESFESFETNNFVVLTGKNGSGKSHLLRAIKNGHVTIEGIAPERVFLFDANSFTVGTDNLVDPMEISRARYNLWEKWQTQNVRGNPFHTLQSILGEASEAVEKRADELGLSLLDLNTSEFSEPETAEKLRNYQTQLGQYRKNPQIFNGLDRKMVEVLAQSAAAPNRVTEIEFYSNYDRVVRTEGILPNSLSTIFADYHSLEEENYYSEFRNSNYSEKRDILSKEKFEEMFGEKPWKVINEFLKNIAGLPYQINSPEGYDRNKKFVAQLTRTDNTSIEVPFGNLSSGEKTLLALIASIYGQLRTKSQLPALLLLDEVDASLHPSMSRALIQTVQKYFVEREICVILVTHSPATVAVAPHSSIYQINLKSNPIIQPIHQSEAVELLSEGFMTLSDGKIILEQVANSKLAILTEGHNTLLLQKGLELHAIAGVQVVQGIESKSGKEQLKGMFEFLKLLRPKCKFLFIVDNDAKEFAALDETDEVKRYVLPTVSNKYVDRGIENLFSEELLTPFLIETKRPQHELSKSFDKGLKKQFAESIVSRNNFDDFNGFLELFSKIRTILQ
jgi:ABC-type uncharacterized transport system ATPase component